MSERIQKNRDCIVIHLDTSFLIRSLQPHSKEDYAMRIWLSSGESLGMSTVGWSEFLCGPLSSEAITLAETLLSELVPFGRNEAEVTSVLFNQSGRRRGSMVDCMIAATALCRDEQLATSNTKDFRYFESIGLKLFTVITSLDP